MTTTMQTDEFCRQISNRLFDLNEELKQVRSTIRTMTALATDETDGPESEDVIEFLELLDGHLEHIHAGINQTCDALDEHGGNGAMGHIVAGKKGR